MGFSELNSVGREAATRVTSQRNGAIRGTTENSAARRTATQRPDACTTIENIHAPSEVSGTRRVMPYLPGGVVVCDIQWESSRRLA